MLRPLNILQVVFLLHILAAYVAVFERMKRSEGMIKVTLEKSCIDFFFFFLHLPLHLPSPLALLFTLF